MNTYTLTAGQIDQFQRDGIIVLKGFYETSDDLLEVQKGIYDVIGLVIARHDLDLPRPPFSAERFDAGFMALVARDRAFGAEVYDAIKQIPAFRRMVSDGRHSEIFRQLRNESLPGIAGGGSGIRIDLPGEDEFRAGWHQEYPAQLRSMDGLVFWAPLVPITESLGPVRFCLRSHVDGPVPVHRNDPRQPNKRGAYSLVLQNEEQRVGRYEQVAPLTNPGDLVLIDFLLLHSSGHNRGNRPRWSMQFRYFNFNDATGIRIGWQGSFAAGKDFGEVHPELCAKQGANP